MQDIEDGNRDVITSIAHIFEVIYILSGYYKQDRRKLATALIYIISQKSVIMPDKKILIDGLSIYRDAKIDLDIHDAYAIAYAIQKGNSKITSFDRDFDKYPEVRREETK